MSYQSARNEMEKGHASCSAEAVLSPIANQWEWCQIWHMSICQMALKKKKRRNQGLQKEQRQGIMCGEIEILGIGVHCVSSWVYSSSWAAWGNMEEIKAWQNIAKMGLEEERKWQVNRVSRLTENVSNQVHFFFFLFSKPSVLKTQDTEQVVVQLLGVRAGRDELRLFVHTLCGRSPLLVYQTGNGSLLAKISLSVESEKIKSHIPFHLKALKKHWEPEKGYS